uniref:BLOC-2 complex member HPS3 N-terminal domain-containing protein n=1 Tax=Petromyzon marinus TaxID=7757 RepID=S4RQD9_PETMA
MVRVYGCHPFCGQEVLPVCEEPSLLASGSRTVLALAATRALLLPVQLGPTARALRPFPAAGDSVTAMAYSETETFLRIVPEEGKSKFERYYKNECAGRGGNPHHVVRFVSFQVGARSCEVLKDFDALIYLALSEQPLCLACCPTTGNLLVGAAGKRLGLFCRVAHVQRKLNLVDFERFAVLTVAFSPLEVALCENYLAFRSEIDVQVLQVDMGAFAGKGLRQDGSPSARLASFSAVLTRFHDQHWTRIARKPRRQNCRHVEWAGMPTLMHNLGSSLHFSSILYRKFVPSLSAQAAREDLLHSLQLVPIYVHNWHEARTKPPLGGERQMAALSCFFSQSREGFLYDVLDSTRLVSHYQYSAVSLQAALGTHLLYVVT